MEKVDLRNIGDVGECPSVEHKLVLQLAVELQRLEDAGRCSVSWDNQEKAMAYFNEHGFVATLDHLFNLREQG